MVLFLCSLLCRVTQLALFLFLQQNGLNITSEEQAVGIVRKSKGDAAYLSDTFIIRYYQNEMKPCNLMQIGRFGEKFLGWAVQKRAKYKHDIDLAVSHIKLSGEFARLRKSGGKEYAPRLSLRWRRAALTMPPRPQMKPSFSVSCLQWPCYIKLLFELILVVRLNGFLCAYGL